MNILNIENALKKSIKNFKNHQPQKQQGKVKKNTSIEIQNTLNIELLPTDMSDSSSDGGRKMEFINDADCNSMHEKSNLCF